MTLDLGDEPGKLFVGGLSWETTIEKLTEYFCRYGEVTDCVVMKNAETGRSRGFGFVTFKDPSCVQIIMASGPHALDGRTIDPKECNPKGAQKGKREVKVGNFPKVFLGGLPANVNESVLRDFFSKYGKVMEVVIMYDQEKKKTRGNGFRGFGFLSFDNEDTIDKVVAEHFVNINGKQVEIKRAEPRDKQSGKSIGGHMGSNAMQAPVHPMAGHPMPQWNAMWGPQTGPPMHVPPPPGQPPPPPQSGAPIPGVPNGMMPSAYPSAWNAGQQGAYATGNGWTPPNYQNYQGWAGYGYPPQGWAQGYNYGPYNTTYPGYGQASAQSATNTGQSAQTPIASNATAAAANTVGGYMPTTPVASNMTPSAQSVISANVASSTPQTAGAPIGNYSQDASNYGPARIGTYSAAANYSSYPLQGQGDGNSVSGQTTYSASASNSQSSSSYNRVASQTQGYHPYRRV